MSVERHGTTVDCLCILCLVSREAFWSLNAALSGNMAQALGARD